MTIFMRNLRPLITECYSRAVGRAVTTLVIGNSMGGMHTWIWGIAHADFMDALVPLASQPTAASRNWMMRRLIIDAIRNAPAITIPRRGWIGSRRCCCRSTPPMTSGIPERSNVRLVGVGRVGVEEADHRHRRLLRTRGGWPSTYCAGE